MEKIPVIVLNWNGFNDTVECIDSLLKQSWQDFIIYLVDNCSSNHEFEKLQEKYKTDNKIVFQKNETNLGFTIAHNQLFDQLKNSDAPYIALINNDAVADINWLENAILTGEKEKADIVSCLMINYNNRKKTDSAGLFMLSSGEILPVGHDTEIGELPDNINVISASGGACLYRISMLNEIGTFDSYFSTGYEDAELGLRAFLSGKKIVLASNARVFHKMSQSVSKIFNRRKSQKIQEDINYTYLKLMPPGVIVFNAIFNIPRWVVVILVHFFTFRFRFILIQIGALIRTCKEIKLIFKKRKEFRKHRKQGTIMMLKAQTFFLSYDMKRFIQFIVKRRHNQFENY